MVFKTFVSLQRSAFLMDLEVGRASGNGLDFRPLHLCHHINFVLFLLSYSKSLIEADLRVTVRDRLRSLGAST
jgi:hypothetical protein